MSWAESTSISLSRREKLSTFSVLLDCGKSLCTFPTWQSSLLSHVQHPCCLHLSHPGFSGGQTTNNKAGKGSNFSKNAERFQWTCTRDGWQIFLLCGKNPQLLPRVARRRYQFLSCRISCSVMLSTNSHSSKSFLNVATIGGEKPLQTHIVAVGSYWPMSVLRCVTSHFLSRQCSDVCLNSRSWFFLMIQHTCVAEQPSSFRPVYHRAAGRCCPATRRGRRTGTASACYVG